MGIEETSLLILSFFMGSSFSLILSYFNPHFGNPSTSLICRSFSDFHCSWKLLRMPRIIFCLYKPQNRDALLRAQPFTYWRLETYPNSNFWHYFFLLYFTGFDMTVFWENGLQDLNHFQTRFLLFFLFLSSVSLHRRTISSCVKCEDLFCRASNFSRFSFRLWIKFLIDQK